MKTRQEAIEALDTAIENGVIRNTEMKDIKNRAARLFEQARSREIGERFTYAGKFANLTEEEREIEMALPLELHQITSKKLARLLDGATETEFTTAVKHFVAEWSEVQERINTLKPMVQKGRKPSTEPRKTPDRTLDNTGTCGCCGKNVKMDSAGRLVDHGFQVRWGQRNGKCFGVGFEPVEVSPKVLEAMAEMMQANEKLMQGKLERLHKGNEKIANPMYDARRRRHLPEFLNPGDEGYDRAKRSYIEQLSRDLKHIARDIEDTKVAIANWMPRPLPGQ
jgi:hypothetical protein